LLDNLAHFDIVGISDKLETLLARVDHSLGQLNFAEINAGITNLLTSANRVVGSTDLTNAIALARQTLDEAKTLIHRIDGRVDSLADSVTNTLHDAQKALADLRVAVQTVSDLLGPDSSIPSDLRQTLQELSTASRAITDLAEFLERNPNSLLTGRKRPKAP
jgi:paraquat-inducible protein B